MQIDVLTSGIWQMNSTILSRRGACVVVDPAYFIDDARAYRATLHRLLEVRRTSKPIARYRTRSRTRPASMACSSMSADLR
ncbi:MAG TPA: hypothetical protein VF516_27135 [Kofleriaceae bacterium]